MTEARSPEAHLEAVVYGRVQGVNFRAFTQMWARALGLKGYVRNLPIGAVEVHAEGPRDHLEELIKRLRQGPAFAQVQKVDVAWSAPVGASQDFQVRR